MTDTTSGNALPYPEPGDPVANGAAAIKALAEKVNTLHGEVGFENVNCAANTNTTVRIDYAHDYDAAVPFTFTTLRTTPAGQVTTWISAPDSTGFTLGVRAAVAAVYTIHWEARL